MTRFDLRTRLFAVALSALAGYVDAIGFLKAGGFFVSFMSGNTTRLGVGIALHGRHGAIAGGLITTFVAGVMLGSFTGHLARHHRPAAVLALVAALLGLAIFVDPWQPAAAVALLALAMGAENAIFERDGDVPIGLTYMTGALVKVGQRLVLALLGGNPTGWLPFLLLWAGLAGGAVAGALCHQALGPWALRLAGAYAVVLTVAAFRMPPPILRVASPAPTVPQ